MMGKGKDIKIKEGCGLVETELDISEEKLFEIIKNDETLTKYLNKKNYKKRIYIKNKLMNIII